jgi:hypothetical protein
MRLATFTALSHVVLVCSCSPALPQGQFGPYYRQSKHLVLAPRETLTVYRVKYWTFNDGSSPALQLEYEAAFPVSDTAAVRREARHLWPTFVPYVEHRGLRAAILTATNFRLSGVWPIAWTSHDYHFGLIAEKGPGEAWYLQHDAVPLPPSDSAPSPRIIDVNGQPVPFTFPLIQPSRR